MGPCGSDLRRLADAVRRLIETTVSVEAPSEVLVAARHAVERVVEDLRPHVPPEPAAGPRRGLP
jgi:hypothetical protein